MTEDEQVSIGEGEAEAASVSEPPPAEVGSDDPVSAEAVEAAEAPGAEAQPAPEAAQDASEEPRPDDQTRPADEESGRQGDEPSETPPPDDEPAAAAWRSYVLKGEQRRPGDCVVIFARSAYNKVVEHLSRDVSREHGGLLLGLVAESPFSDGLAVWVTNALPAKHTKGSRSRLTFTQDSWADFDDVTEHLRRHGMELKRVGWYHSHPSFGVFLSSYDLNVCEDFRLPTHVALVYDPINHEGGFFVRGEAGYDPRSPQGFWEFPDTQPAPPVDWHNIEGVEDGLPSANSDEASEAGEPAESAPAPEVLQIGKNLQGGEEVVVVEPEMASPVEVEAQSSKPVASTPEQTATPEGEGRGQKDKTRGSVMRTFKKGFTYVTKKLRRAASVGNGAEAMRPASPSYAPPPASVPAAGAAAGAAANAEIEARASEVTGEARAANLAGVPSVAALVGGATEQSAAAEALGAMTTGEEDAGHAPREESAARPASHDGGAHDA